MTGFEKRGQNKKKQVDEIVQNGVIRWKQAYPMTNELLLLNWEPVGDCERKIDSILLSRGEFCFTLYGKRRNSKVNYKLKSY